MSFESIPEEILEKISKLTADACYYDAPFHGSLGFDLDQDIWCEDCGLAPLASVNVKMRRICMLILFSHIVLQAVKGPTPSANWVVPSLGFFRRLISQRPNVAQHILSIRLCTEPLTHCDPHYNTVWPNRYDLDIPYMASHLEQLQEVTDMLALLPRLRSLPVGSLHPDFMRAIMEHDSLHHICLPDIPVFYPDSAAPEFESASFAPMYLERLVIHSIDESLAVDSIPKRLLKLGVNVQYLMVKASLAQRQFIPTFEHTQIEELIFFYVNGLSAGLVADFAKSITHSHPEISKCAFFPSGSADVFSKLDVNFPLLSEIISGVERSMSSQKAFWSVARIYFYGVERMPSSATGVTEEHWRITSLDLDCFTWPFPISFLHAIASGAPCIRFLKLEPTYSAHIEDGHEYIDADHLVKGLSAFKCLEQLRLRRVQLPPLNKVAKKGRHEAQFMRLLCVALKEKCPCLGRVICGIITPLWLDVKFWEMSIRRQLLVDGGRIETWKIRVKES